ncbi:lipopolysaccharide export system permease protein [Ekhidna lutea]|uniref:Lipopolysaccharide export system permease protein n=1 Tax=Ekhidna lutea TaxID=447679 RepID=A0A239JN46_EKHLU|nr:LptF/LptG family permease [Ekhidna lutea]SNT07321.1 lipopolysaccharide export system permease protein [Ekhidna lutea]
MKKLDWYILKKILITFVFVVGMFEVIICVLDYADKNDDFIKNEVSLNQIYNYYITFIPFIAGLLTPITVFIATVFVTAQLAAKTEIIAILASGVSFRRMLFPYLIAALMIGTASFYLNSYVIPEANKFRIDFEYEYLKDPFYNTDKHIHLKIAERDSLEDYIYMYRYDVRRDVGSSVTLETVSGTQLVEKVTARQIEWNDETGKWKLKRWQNREIKDREEIITEGDELDTLLNMSPEDFGNKERIWETMTMTELNHYIARQKSRGADDVHIFQVEEYIRYMSPFTVLILMAIGVIVAARKSRQGTGFQIALGFVIAFAFIIAFVLARAIAEAQSMNTVLAIWMPNIIFATVAVFLYKTVPR